MKREDFEKIKTLHGLNSNFDVSKELQSELLKQLDKEKSSSDLERFFNGYEAEEIFRFVYSSLPWVKLISKLDQDQLPIYSKEKYQVPDFLVYFEDNKLIDNAILIEAKSVQKNKMKLELMAKQVESLLRYAETLKTPLLFAIYWRKTGAWILTSIEYFKKKNSTYSIDLLEAVKCDLSVFLSDFSFVINNNVFLKTHYKPNKTEYSVKNEFGYIHNHEVSTDGTNYFKIDLFEAAVLDSLLGLKLIYKKIEDNNDVITIEQPSETYIPKLSYAIMKYIKLFNSKINSENSLFAAHTIFNY